jgi:hypothetical protein
MMAQFLHTPQYTTVESVKVRLAGKVQFQQDPNEDQEGELPDALLHQLIVDAETEVEQDLRGRYAIPFRSKTRGKFSELPDHSKRAIRMAVDLKAVIMVLETDFGRGTHVSGEGYSKTQKEKYESTIKKLLGVQKNLDGQEVQKKTPPLEDMLLAACNSAADDGFKGMIINTDQSTDDSVTYAEEQINDPGHSYAGRRPRGFIP